MYNQAGQQAYRRNKYETASPHRLIQMLYEAALHNIANALMAIDNRQIAVAHRNILRAQEIVNELLSCLNEEKGGAIATSLKEIYIYSIRQLIQANLRKQRQPLEEVQRVLTEIKSAWDQIGKEVAIGKA